MALGMIEVFGFATAIVVADAMAKSADVKVVGVLILELNTSCKDILPLRLSLQYQYL